MSLALQSTPFLLGVQGEKPLSSSPRRANLWHSILSCPPSSPFSSPLCHTPHQDTGTSPPPEYPVPGTKKGVAPPLPLLYPHPAIRSPPLSPPLYPSPP